MMQETVLTESTALSIPEGTGRSEWEKMGDQLAPAIQAAEEAGLVGWAVGDWLAYGIAAFGNAKGKGGTYDSAMQKTGYSKATLQTYASVARSVPALNRIKGLSFTHHFAVAALAPEPQGAMLQMALEKQLKVRDLKKATRAFQLFEPKLGAETAFGEAVIVAEGGKGNSLQSRLKAYGIETPEAKEKRAAKETFPPLGEFENIGPYLIAAVNACPNTRVRAEFENRTNSNQFWDGVFQWPGYQQGLADALEECAARCASYAASMREKIAAAFETELQRVANGDRIAPGSTPQVFRMMNPDALIGKQEPPFVAPPHFASALEEAFAERRRLAALTPAPSELATAELEAA